MTISANHHVELNKLSSTSPWIWLFEMRHSETEAYRVTPYTRQVTFGGNIFYPAWVAIGEIPKSSDGDNATLAVTVRDPSRELQTVLDENEGFTDRVLLIQLAHSDHLADGAAFAETFRVVSTAVTWEGATFTCGAYDLFASKVPRNLFLRSKCRWTYRSASGAITEECGYQEITQGAGLATCDKTLSGPNGCIVHGQDEVANGFERLHPRRFGGFPGIPANRR